MFPFIFEWVWDSGHYIFFGAMWYVILILSTGLSYCLIKSVKDSINGDGNDHHH